ncbi:SUN domain-containing protein 2 isoform X2 [Clarias gariepinus]|uniref:SUN domain-containing protein 2 isoform X2 n=1 Tax=Clarias gariepinus TaxID=13013 RepID=UPI00234D9D4A|nr:SUN domain-containing protein 2 isoform X2 [Clarias gariepinus]
MSSLSEQQQGDSRRSARLVSSKYYLHDDDTASNSSTGSAGLISYKESPVRAFSRRKVGPRKGGGASHGSKVTNSQTPSPTEFLTPRKTFTFQAPRSTVTSVTSSAPSTSAQVDPSGFSSGYSSAEEGYGRKSSATHSAPTNNTTAATTTNTNPAYTQSKGWMGHRDILTAPVVRNILTAPVVRNILTAPARALAVVYVWLGVAWYSITSGMSLLNVSLLSKCTAGVRKSVLLFILFLLLLFCMWYWYPWVIALFPRSTRTTPIQPHATTQAPIQPRVDNRETYASFAALRDELYADLRERENKWLEDRDRGLEDMLKAIKLLKEDGEKQKRMHEVLQMDVHDLKIRVRNVDSEHNGLIKEETLGMQNQISELKLDVSKLHSASEYQNRRLDAQEAQNRKLKTELSDWLLNQLSGSVKSEGDVVMRPELQRALEDLEKKLLDRLEQERRGEERRDVWRTVGETLQEEGVGAVSITDVERIVQRALSLHKADGIGLADYALESSGASVVNTRCSETYHTRSACISLFGFPLWYPSESPRTVIQPELHPGKCWPFRGSEGFLVIALSHPVQITQVTLEHLPRILSPTGRIDSAPKDFAVYGMISEEKEEGKLLGTFTYDQDGESIQTFVVQHPQSEVYGLVELRILSNWGHPEYTCVYRFRVHGQPRLPKEH